MPTAITAGDYAAGKIWAKSHASFHGHNPDTKMKKRLHFTNNYYVALHRSEARSSDGRAEWVSVEGGS